MSLMLVTFMGQSFAQSQIEGNEEWATSGIVISTVEEREDYKKIEISLPDGSKEYVIQRGDEKDGVTLESINKEGISKFVERSDEDTVSISDETGAVVETINLDSGLVTLEADKSKLLSENLSNSKISTYSYPTRWAYLGTNYGNIRSNYSDISLILSVVATVCGLPVGASIVYSIASHAYINKVPNLYYKRDRHSRMLNQRSAQYRRTTYFYRHSNYTGYVNTAVSYSGWAY